MGKYCEALADFNQSIVLQPDVALSYNSRGLVLDQLEKHHEALQDFTHAIALDPKNSIFYHNRGFCHRNMERYQDAIIDYRYDTTTQDECATNNTDV